MTIEERNALLRELWFDESLTLADIAKRIGVRRTSVHRMGARLGLPRRGYSDAAKAAWREAVSKTMAGRPRGRPRNDDVRPGRNMPDAEIAALYAGRRYEDHERPTVTFGKPPMRQVGESLIGCAAAMTAGVA